MNTNVLPIIFLAFANDYEGGYGYLPALASERRNLQAVLDRAQQNGLCEVILRSDATLDDLVGVFQDERYRGRIAIFHFGGHAGAYELLLQSADGKHATAYADGLAAFLGRQPNLQLVFLNGCSTQPHVEGLHAAGIPVVIATHAEIEDQLTGDFALRFYRGLATGATIESAYHTAEAAGRAANAEVRAIMEAGYLPWALSVRAGAEAVSGWSLPEAAENPLFGLPPLPPGDLPAQPFRNILWFRREDAPLFFGRGYDIRALYQRITAPGAAPIVLYYGQSGVGKSSLLAAGLLPRLEQVHTVVYTRRDQALGLTGTLAAMLAANLPGSFEASWKVSTADLPFHWRAIEAETGKPLTVILDQVEEVYTRPNETMPSEMDAFLAALVALFADSTARPQGRLILSFRKEYLADIESVMDACHLPRTRVFLQRLDRRGIIEAVTGPARSERQRQHFGLSMEDGLAAEIADDLLADPSSAVAPTLQILLSKLWEQAKARAYDHPHFDRTLYHDLRRKGLLLNDFLDQQLATLRTRQPAAVESGLALDLLAFHTTPLGTAEQRTLAELRTMYAHQSMTLDGLLAACRDLYLLIDPAENRPDAVPDARITRLAHDTLAPLVRHRFEESDAPGQRARRILESREANNDTAQAYPMGEPDLAIVETGQTGMRTWKEPEVKLIALSRAARTSRRKRDRLVRSVLSVLVAMVGVAAIVAFWQWGAANSEARRADEKASEAIAAQATAQAEAENARRAQVEAEMQAAIARARQLASQSASELDADRYEVALLLAIETGLATEAIGISPVQEAFAVIRSAIVHPSRSRTVLYGHTDSVTQAIWSPDGSRILTGSDDGTVRIWDSVQGTELTRIKTGPIEQLIWNQDETKILVLRRDGTVRIWDTTNGEALAEFGEWKFGQVTWSRDESKILTWNGGAVRIWDAADGVELVAFEDRTAPDFKTLILEATWNRDESRVLTVSIDGTIHIWDVASGAELVTIKDQQLGLLPSTLWSPDGSRVLSAGSDYSIHIWDAENGAELLKMEGHTGGVYQAKWSRDGSRILTSSDDGTVRIWDTESGTEINRLSDSTLPVTLAVWSHDESRVFVSQVGTNRIWDTSTGKEMLELKTGQVIKQAAWSSDDSRILVVEVPAGDASIWDTASGAQLVRLPGTLYATWGRDESTVLTWGFDSAVRIWDTSNGVEIARLEDRTERITKAAWSPNESRVFIAGNDRIHIWDATSGTSLNKLEVPSGNFLQVTWSHDGTRLLTTQSDGSIRVWDAEIDVELTKFDDTSHAIWSRDESKILTAETNGTAHIYDAVNGVELVRFSGHTGPVTQAAWSQDESRVLTTSEDKTVRIWNAASGAEQVRFEGQKQGTWSRDGSKVLTTDGDKTVRIWDVASGEELIRLEDDRRGTASAVWNRDESKVLIYRSHLAFARNNDLAIHIWDATNGAALVSLEGHRREITQATWNHDGSRVLTSSWDGTARIWDAFDGMELLKFEGHIGGVTQATWSNDESKVLTVSRDYTARIWDAASGAELVRFESVLEATWSQDESRILTVGIDGTARILYTGISDLLAATCRRAPRNFNIEEWNRFIKGPYRPTCEEAPIPSDVIDAIKTQAASETQAGNIPAATVLLSQLDRWLRTNGQYLTFEVETNPYLNLARLLFVADDYAEGIVALANAQVISPTIDITTTLPVSDWNQVCRHGALASVATEVMPACARAVALAPEHGDYRDSRGLALALTGDVPGAIEDFRFFVAWAKTTGQGRNVDWREEWIARLEAGESPAVVFDAATLQRLRNE